MTNLVINYSFFFSKGFFNLHCAFINKLVINIQFFQKIIPCHKKNRFEIFKYTGISNGQMISKLCYSERIYIVLYSYCICNKYQKKNHHKDNSFINYIILWLMQFNTLNKTKHNIKLRLLMNKKYIVLTISTVVKLQIQTYTHTHILDLLKSIFKILI